MRPFASVLIGFLLMAAAPAGAEDLSKFKPTGAKSRIVVDHSKWAAFLKAYVVPGTTGLNLVRYGAVTPEDKATLAAYVVELKKVDPTSLGRDEAFAYWANLYNAITVKLIIENYPVKSIRQIKSGPISIGPWGRKIATVDGIDLSLDDIEHKILRAYFADNRVHYALNCASIGCPDLGREPWTSEGLSGALDAAARRYVNSARGVRVENGKIVASSIFNWFAKDFGASEKEVVAYLAGLADGDLKNALLAAKKIDKYQYDWAVNEAKG